MASDAGWSLVSADVLLTVSTTPSTVKLETWMHEVHTVTPWSSLLVIVMSASPAGSFSGTSMLGIVTEWMPDVESKEGVKSPLAYVWPPGRAITTCTRLDAVESGSPLGPPWKFDPMIVSDPPVVPATKVDSDRLLTTGAASMPSAQEFSLLELMGGVPVKPFVHMA